MIDDNMKILMFILGAVMGGLIAATIANAANYCIDSDTMVSNETIQGTLVTTMQDCPYGCVNNECSGTNISADTTSIYLTAGAGVVMLVLGVVLGLPIGRQEKEMSKGFNTTIVVKYIFFFLGMFLMYMSMGMTRRLGTVYGSDANITDATDTVTMVMLWISILFLFIFVIEFIAGVIKKVSEIRVEKEKKKYTREETEEE